MTTPLLTTLDAAPWLWPLLRILVPLLIIVIFSDRYLQKSWKKKPSFKIFLSRIGLFLATLIASILTVFYVFNLPMSQLSGLASKDLFLIDGKKITPLTIVLALLAFSTCLGLSRLVNRLALPRMSSRMKIDRGVSFALGRFNNYFFLSIGLYLALSLLGLPLGALAGVFAMLSVGIGFGLQNITSNFISGIILLVERPVKIGDRISVDDVWGEVIQINLRTTVINTTDNITIIVPNSKLLENNLVNWSYGDERIRQRLNIGVSYSSNMELVQKVLLEVADAHERILKTPAPEVWLKSFGDSSLDCQLLIWLPNSLNKDRTISEINFAITKAFRENEISIPFPQRDIHFKSSFNSDPLPETK